MKCKISMGVAVILPYFLFAWVLPAAAQKPKATVAAGVQLTVKVTDVKHTEGNLLIGVFSQKDGFPREIQKALVSAKIKPGQPTHTFKNLPQGDYAVVVIHDRNKNGKLDRNLFGMPKEPVGLSNYPSIGISNPPTFRKALFTLKTSGLLKVKLNPF
jgi:uncharacterized protein (DUF2141 family)